MKSENAVKCTQIEKDFGVGDNKTRVLRGVDFVAPFGGVTFLVGPSGCGKTTLLSVIAGLLDPSGGEVDVLGEKINRLKGSDAVLFRRKNIGFVFQQFNLLPALTAAEMRRFPCSRQASRRKERWIKPQRC